MSVKSMMARIQDAKAEYEKALAAAGGEVREEIARSLGAMLPEGWRLAWHQSDDQYNDENYYFGFSYARLVSDRIPREGRLLKPEVAEVSQLVANRWGGYDKKITTYAEPAVYEQIIDDQCQVRELDDHGAWEGAGCIHLLDFDFEWRHHAEEYASMGLTREMIQPLVDAWQSLDNNMMQNAFGRMASVTVTGDGGLTIDNKRGSRY